MLSLWWNRSDEFYNLALMRNFHLNIYFLRLFLLLFFGEITGKFLLSLNEDVVQEVVGAGSCPLQ
jgi:hypothetical protein